MWPCCRGGPRPTCRRACASEPRTTSATRAWNEDGCAGISEPRRSSTVPHPAPERAWVLARLLEQEVPRQVPDPWLVVEPKGPAVTFHYRAAPDVAAAGIRVARSVDRLDPDRELVRFPGRRSLELRPPGAPAKGEAFRSLLDDVRPAVAFMIGDDRTDVAAFRVLRAARDAGELHGRAIAVGPDPTMFDATGHEADVVLGTPRDVAAFLAALARVAGERNEHARTDRNAATSRGVRSTTSASWPVASNIVGPRRLDPCGCPQHPERRDVGPVVTDHERDRRPHVVRQAAERLALGGGAGRAQLERSGLPGNLTSSAPWIEAVDGAGDPDAPRRQHREHPDSGRSPRAPRLHDRHASGTWGRSSSTARESPGTLGAGWGTTTSDSVCHDGATGPRSRP